MTLSLDEYATFLDRYPDELIDDHRELFAKGLRRLSDERGGEVYVCQHPAWPGLFKIGCTQRAAQTRVAELKTAGMLGEHVLLASWWHFDARSLEAAAHATLGAFRQGSSEWFSAPYPHIVNTVEAEMTRQAEKAARLLARRLA